MTSVYGPRVTAYDVEQAVVTTLQQWIDTYLGDNERDSAGRWTLRQITRPRSWQVMTDFHASTAERHIPAIIVESGPMAPELGADGAVHGEWAVTVVVIVKGQDRQKTREQLAEYDDAVRRILWQKGSLGGFAVGTVVGTTRPDAVDADKGKTLAGVEIPAAVIVQDISSRWGGPDVPDPPTSPLPPTSPTDPLHTSTKVNVTGHMP